KMDPRDEATDWNDYWEAMSSWAVAFPDMLLKYAAGSAADVNFNYASGSIITIPLAKIFAGKRENLILTGPGISGPDQLVRPTERQTELRLGPPRTNSAGNFQLSVASDPPPGAPPNWVEGFSLNVPAEESTLDRAPIEGIEDLTGKDSV